MEQVLCMGKREIHAKFCSENLKGKITLGDLGIDGRAILKWTLGTQDVKAWTGFMWLRIGSSGGVS
jgi:hypothetical protein